MRMKSHTLFGIGATALLLGGFAAGGVTLAGAPEVGKQAEKAARKATKALNKGQGAGAITLAEAAVALAPQEARYRLLLAQAYLKAGRFASAQATFADVLALEPGNGRAALNLALTKIAGGDWGAARTLLTQHAGAIPARDRGLAWALSGDPIGGVQILMAAAREPGADARTRQNLALALALAGQWREAKMVVLRDMAEKDATRRLMQWMAFARPSHASDQVAALLGVRVVEDAGQPAALALSQPAPAEPSSPPVAVAAVDPAEAHVAAEVPAAGGAVRIVFAERREVVQPLPSTAPRIAAAGGAFKTRLSVAVPPRAPAAGQWYVQLGAFDSAGVARNAWARATRRYAALADHTPAGTEFHGRRGSFYRLAVGGFARGDAVSLCRTLRAEGGACFVRQAAGDRVAAWAKPSRALEVAANGGGRGGVAAR